MLRKSTNAAENSKTSVPENSDPQSGKAYRRPKLFRLGGLNKVKAKYYSADYKDGFAGYWDYY